MVDADAFRRVMGEFATGVTVVTLPGDPPHGITVNAFASLSLAPPLVLVSLDHGTEAHRLFAEEGADSYAVNILTHEQRHLAEHFAGMTDGDTDPFETEATKTAETGAPIFSDSLAYVDCTLYEAIEIGDHTIYAGHAEHTDSLDADTGPLTFYEGDWGTIEKFDD
ncbi:MULTISPECIES: flavin reductase family protein [unclassified Haladaptatus]|uniref:flavin reductase family protein n=1 Tax=unclassified Haladaptatus TaxID=2622732 RepID=UPI00209C60BA|nr:MULTISPECIES: flavin reductase family protein [unclassified Haladaptatus]MCO8244842.1 flavin reductase family protein [Haladaptatus sp. AB643]MCO8255644.1 flavin reductase family protein [Haladaptatus sp. AB618]